MTTDIALSPAGQAEACDAAPDQAPPPALAARRNGPVQLAGTPSPTAAGTRWNGTGEGAGPPGRTWATGVEYHLRYQRLRERAVAAGIGPDDHLGFARWLVAAKPLAQPAYWRKLKAAALAGLDLEGETAAREAEALLRAETTAGTARAAPRRAPRRKGIAAADLRQLFEALIRRAARSELARVTILWLIAGSATGLRPCEWRSAVLGPGEDGEACLWVENAKATNGRAHGEGRTLCLAGVSGQEREAIALLLDAIAARPGGFAALHRACADLLRTVNRELWPRRRELIGLYSARHQFAADAKRVLDRAEVAALMGHKTTRTAGLHYAPAAAAVSALACRAPVRRRSAACASTPTASLRPRPHGRTSWVAPVRTIPGTRPPRPPGAAALRRPWRHAGVETPPRASRSATFPSALTGHS